MLHWYRTRIKAFGRVTLALAGTLWLIAAGAPCVMAQTPDLEPASSRCPEHAKLISTGPAAMPDCGPVTLLNCELPDTFVPLMAGHADFAMTPVLLVTLPLPVLLADNTLRPRHDLLSPDIHAPPLHIRHLTLLL